MDKGDIHTIHGVLCRYLSEDEFNLPDVDCEFEHLQFIIDEDVMEYRGEVALDELEHGYGYNVNAQYVGRNDEYVVGVNEGD